MSSSTPSLARLQRLVWAGSLPLDIRLAPADCRSYDQSDPYLVHVPRLSYLAFLLPKLHAFFAASLIDPDAAAAHDAWLDFDGVPLKWHYPLGLLYDLYSGAEPVRLDGQHAPNRPSSRPDPATPEHRPENPPPLPWRLTVHFTSFPTAHLIPLDPAGRALLDAFINAVKEADFLRNGTARAAMSLSKDDADALWRAVRLHDLDLFNSVNAKLLAPPGLPVRHIPVKIYLPSAAEAGAGASIPEENDGGGGGEGGGGGGGGAAAGDLKPAGRFRVVQAPVPLLSPQKLPLTVGAALHSVLPAVFPSRRNPLLAQPVLHGAVLPMAAPLEELGRAAAFPDGFVHLAVVMLG